MNLQKLTDLYFDWMYGRVCDSSRYRTLLRHLHRINYYSTITMDENRACDGMNLRYIFWQSLRTSEKYPRYLDSAPCSVLEMMVALAIKCEQDMMGDPSEGDRTSVWFNDMLKSMHLETMTDDRFNKEYVNSVVTDMLDRRYSSEGDGGLFFVKGFNGDMREMEVWTQLCQYLNAYYI